MGERDSGFLSWLLGSTPVDLFFQDYWQRKPLLVKGAGARFADLFDKAAFHRAAHQCDNLKISYRDARGVSMERTCAPEHIDAAFQAGSTVCISGIQGNTQLDHFMASFARHVLQAGELSFNCYYSPDGHGFALHLDDHPVWILQIEGKKRWWYSRLPFHKPLSTVSFSQGATLAYVSWAPPIERPDEADFWEVLLEPGDVLYLPEGTWHRAAAADGESLALTLACSRVSPLDLVQQTMAAGIAQSPALRENLPGAWAASVTERVPPELEQQFVAVIEELRGMVNGLTPQGMYETRRRLSTKESSPR